MVILQRLVVLIVLLALVATLGPSTPSPTASAAGPGQTGGVGAAGPTPVAAPTASPASTPVPTPTRAPEPTASPTPTTSSAASVPPATTPSPGPTPSSGPATGPDPAGLGPALQKALERSRVQGRFTVPGVSAAIIFPDGSSWSGASGFANQAAGLAVTTDTSFGLGSVTKTFVAALVLRLVEQGRLRLTDRLSRYLPTYPRASQITIRQLLNHTSGLFDFFSNPVLDQALLKNRARPWTAKEVLAYVKTPYFKPGASWHYSNTNYVLLGLVIEKVTRTSVAVALRRELLGPLELGSVVLQGQQAAAEPVAHGYTATASSTLRDTTDGSPLTPYTSIATAAWTAGGMASTAGDLARWARELYSGRVLSPATTRLMLTFVGTRIPGYSYGLGAQRLAILGKWSVGHGGRVQGFRTAMRHIPGRGITVVVLTNWDRANADGIAVALLKALEPWYPRNAGAPVQTPIPSPSGSPAASASPVPPPSSAPSAAPSPSP